MSYQKQAISQFFGKCVTDGQTDKRTDGWADPLIEMRGRIYMLFLNLLNHVEVALGDIASENGARVVFREHDKKNVTNIVGLSVNIPLVLSHLALF